MAIELTTANNAVLGQIQRYTAQGILWSVFPNITQASFVGGVIGINYFGFVDHGGEMDCQTLGRCRVVTVPAVTGTVGALNVTTISNASVLSLLEDVGTARAFQIMGTRLSSDAINTVFTDLPSTTKTATLDVRFTNGAATCNTTIATSKGYTVVTS